MSAVNKRKGARSIKQIPASILQQLNLGEIETANLIEWLAIDQQYLLQQLLNAYDRQAYLEPILAELAKLKTPKVNAINHCIGRQLFVLSSKNQDMALLNLLQQHRSDMVRCWMCYAVLADSQLTLEQQFLAIGCLAADSHFAVREVAWMAMRANISAYLTDAIEVLAGWAQNPDANLRRFASEVTRPRGVWCSHITMLKQQPQLALPILNPLAADPSRYVQDSVANWLNDASKSQPEFVRSLCHSWQQQHSSPATAYIVKKALRTLAKT